MVIRLYRLQSQLWNQNLFFLFHNSDNVHFYVDIFYFVATHFPLVFPEAYLFGFCCCWCWFTKNEFCSSLIHNFLIVPFVRKTLFLVSLLSTLNYHRLLDPTWLYWASFSILPATFLFSQIFLCDLHCTRHISLFALQYSSVLCSTTVQFHLLDRSICLCLEG